MSRFIVFIFITLFTTVLKGQPTLQQKLQSNLDINTQFITLLNQSRSQDADFKIIRKSNLEIIQRNINDSLNRYKKEITELTSNTSNSVNNIKNLKDSVSTLSIALEQEKSKTDSINFIGIDFNKGAYHTLVWSIIAVLAIAFFVVLLSFRKAKVDAVEHQKTAEEVQNELQTHKKKAMEKEQQLKRQLLDEQLKRNS